VYRVQWYGCNIVIQGLLLSYAQVQYVSYRTSYFQVQHWWLRYVWQTNHSCNITQSQPTLQITCIYYTQTKTHTHTHTVVCQIHWFTVYYSTFTPSHTRARRAATMLSLREPVMRSTRSDTHHVPAPPMATVLAIDVYPDSWNYNLEWTSLTHTIYSLLLRYYTVFRKKVVHLIFSHANVDRFSKFFHWQILCTIRDLHLNWTTLLHYLVKSENSTQLLN